MKVGLNLLIFFVGFFLMVSCNNKEVDQLTKNLTIEQAKVLLLQHSNSGILITKADTLTSTNNIELTYEDGNIVHVSLTHLSKILTDSLRWSTSFFFIDDSEINVLSLGTLDLSESIAINPFGTAPLCALSKLDMPIKGKFKIIVHGKPDGGIAIGHSFNNYGYHHELPILGLYENYNNSVEFQFLDASGKIRTSQIVTITTSAIPNKPTIDVKKNLLSPLDVSIFSISVAEPWGFDQRGEVRWYYSGDFFWSYGKLSNGNIIASSAKNALAGQQSPSLNEISMLGQLVRNYPVVNYQHHEVLEMPNGNLLIGTNSTPDVLNANYPNEDMVSEIERTSGKIIKTWNFNTILDPSRIPLPSTVGQSDWFHLNAVFYNKTDNSIIVSSRSQSAVVKIDYETSQVKWILSNPNFWNTQLSQYLLSPVNANGENINVDGIDFWPYGQHNPTQLDNGNILIYDNGDYRGFYDNASVPSKSYTRAVEYKIDDTKRTIQLVWSFDNNKDIFTKYTGSVEQFGPSKSRMIGYMNGGANFSRGDVPKLVEIDSDNKVIFEANVNLGKFYYRAIKMDLYNGINY